MHPLEQLQDELDYLSVARTVDPQDAERVFSLLSLVEEAYPEEALPEDWELFVDRLETACYGTRTPELLDTIKDQYSDMDFG